MLDKHLQFQVRALESFNKKCFRRQVTLSESILIMHTLNVINFDQNPLISLVLIGFIIELQKSCYLQVACVKNTLVILFDFLLA